MRYFTPELLARSRSLDDDEAEAAAAEWEKKITAYNVRLKKIRRHLPLGARQLLKHVSLHDAQFLTLNRAGSELFLTFRLPGNAHKQAGGVELRYTLAGQSNLVLHEPQASANGPVARWVLYDEFDEARGPRKGMHVRASDDRRARIPNPLQQPSTQAFRHGVARGQQAIGD